MFSAQIQHSCRIGIRICLVIFCALSFPAGFGKLRAEAIVQSEYFIDVDPGAGLGIPISLLSEAGGNYRFSANIDLSQAAPGYHRLGIRAKSHSGIWTFSHMRTFFISQQNEISEIIRSEYFIDTDPGLGLGIPIPITAGFASGFEGSIGIDYTGLASGYHKLYVRAQNADRQWTFTHLRTFLVPEPTPEPQAIVYSEYFIDTDPGLGNAIPITSDNPPAWDTNYSLNIDMQHLQPGYHTVNIRAKNADGIWTQTLSNRVLKAPDEETPALPAYAEYFIDTDPGYGMGTPIDIAENAIDINLASLNPGYHSVFIRARDTKGIWTQTLSRRFYHLPLYEEPAPVAAAEYFIDTDPGLGLGIAIPLERIHEQSYHLGIDASSLAEGYHSLAIRCKDTKGSWTQTGVRRFYHIPSPEERPYLTHAEYFIDSDPGMGAGIQIPLSDSLLASGSFVPPIEGLPTGFHTVGVRVRNSKGAWSLSSYRRFYQSRPYDQLSPIVAAEYFFDEDPGYGHGTAIAVEPDTLLVVSFAASAMSLVPGQHKLYVRAKTDSWSQVHYQQFYGGSPFAIETPEQVNGVNVRIVNYDAVITWLPVTQAISGHPITPDAYIVLYNESPFDEEDDYYYLGYTYQTQMHHYGVARFRDRMFYKVIAVIFNRNEAEILQSSRSDASKPLKRSEIKALLADEEF